MKYRRSKIEQAKIKNRKSEAGTGSVELAMLSPLLVLMLLGTIDFARLWYDGIAVANAARAGVQYGAQRQSTSGNIAGMVQATMEDAQDVDGVSVTAEQYCECSGGTPVDCINGNCGFGDSPRIYVKVTAEKTFQTLFPYPGIPHTVAVRQEAVMRAR